MRLLKIELLSEYKCFKRGTEFNFYNSNIICIIGKNSTGKTIFLNLVNDIFEAIKSPRLNFDLNFRILIEYNNSIYKIERNGLEVFFINSLEQICKSFPMTVKFDSKIENTIIGNIDNILNIIGIKRNIEILGDPRGEVQSQGFKNITYIKNNLGLFNFSPKLKYENLSSGEQNLIKTFSLLKPQRNNIGQNISLNEILFLLDEPDANLNNELKRKYITLLEEALQGTNSQIILTTHSTELISDLDEIQVYKCEDFEIKNINFNPFGEDNSILTEKLFGDVYNISDKAKRAYEYYRNSIKSSYYDKEKLNILKKEILLKFSDSLYRNELLELIRNLVR